MIPVLGQKYLVCAILQYNTNAHKSTDIFSKAMELLSLVLKFLDCVKSFVEDVTLKLYHELGDSTRYYQCRIFQIAAPCLFND